jgi:hypothetical protein
MQPLSASVVVDIWIVMHNLVASMEELEIATELVAE